MTVIYHGTPITPEEVLTTLKGKAFCLTYYYRSKFNLANMLAIGSLIMVDWGIYPAWKAGVELGEDYRRAYYEWVDPILDSPCAWAVIPDLIGEPSQILDALIKEWPHGDRGAPVFHFDAQMSHSPDRLLRLLDEWPRVCIGWAEKDLPILGDDHQRQLDRLWNEIEKRHGRRTPTVHHFRGTQLARQRWPFATLDSTDVARNHNRPQNTALDMADRWDAANCPPRWVQRELVMNQALI